MNGFRLSPILNLVAATRAVGHDKRIGIRGADRGQQRPYRLWQAEPDAAADQVVIGPGQAMRGKGRIHGIADRRLAIDQRAIAIEHRQPNCHGARFRISAAMPAAPFASSAAATRSRSSAGLFWLSFSVSRQASTSNSNPTIPPSSLRR